MARAKIDLPSKFHFSTEIPVRITDMNYNDHLGNDAVLALVHEARVRFFRSLGWTELDVDGTGIIMADAVIVYKSESFYGDILKIEIAVSEIETASFDFVYRVSNKETGKEVARLKTGIVFFDYTSHKPVPMPDKFRSLFAK